MKKFLTVLFALTASLLTFVGCEEEPIASFTVSSTLVGTNQNVNFTNTSTDADHFEWYFGDGTSSTDENPTHSYSQQGNYIVTLVAYSKSGRKLDDAYQAYVWVLNPYEVIFHNPTYTPITITVTNYGTQTIPVDGSATFVVYTSTPSFTATTSETFSNGNPLGLTISWEGTLELSSSTSNINLNVGTSIFYLFTKNTSSYYLGPIYSNYGSSYQVYINTSLPINANTWYRLGYHNARYNTEIRWYYTSSYYYYAIAGTHFTFPNTSNQNLSFNIGSKSLEVGNDSAPLQAYIKNSGEIRTCKEPKKEFQKVPGSIDLFPITK